MKVPTVIRSQVPGTREIETFIRGDESRAPNRIVLADNHPLVRAGVKALIQEIGGFLVVAEASDGLEALRLIAKYQPDLVFLEIALPGLNGLEVLAHVTKEFPNVRMVILTSYEIEEYADMALSAGAAGYMTKSSTGSELSLAIETVMRGEKFLSLQFLVRSFREHSKHLAEKQCLHEGLTPRQHDVLRMIAEGHTTKHIALKLDISAKTVETHRANLMERLNIHDVAGLVRHAIKIGLVSIDDPIQPRVRESHRG